MKRPFGQNFLFDKNILRKIVACSGVTKKDSVVEVGPGLGTLTSVLAEQAGKVIAIEFDRKLIARLKENVYDFNNVEIVNYDALKFQYESLQGKFRVVANIPYNITTPLIFRLLEYRKKIQSMTLLMQKEVAKRIVASPGNSAYGVLSLSLRLYTKPVLKFTVSKKAFSPPPKVDSAVVHFTVSDKPLLPVKDANFFLDVVKTAFGQRRKTVMNSLNKYTAIKEALLNVDIDPEIRPERLTIDDFVRLSNKLKNVN